MGISATQLWNNIFLMLVMALLVEVAISSIFSIKFFDDLMKSNISKSVKNLLVLVVCFGLAAKIPQLRIFYKAKLSIPSLIHMILSSLVLARLANIFHDWFSTLKSKSAQSN